MLQKVALASLQLIRSRRVGPVTWHRLVAEHGVSGALQALPQIAAEAGVSGYEVCPLGVVRAEMAAAEARKAGEAKLASLKQTPGATPLSPGPPSSRRRPGSQNGPWSTSSRRRPGSRNAFDRSGLRVAHARHD